MKRRWKILIGVLVALALLLTVNTIVLESQTKEASVNVEGGQILHLSNGDVQVVDSGEPEGDGSLKSLDSKPAGQPIVLIHGYAGSVHWFDKLTPLLTPNHRVVRIDLLGFGGSEKPQNGYAITDQARLVAEAMNKLGVSGAMVVGHSMGGAVTASLAEQASELVDRAVVIDEAPDDTSEYGYELPFLQDLSYKPVLGEAIWRTTPDFAIHDGLEDAFAPGFDFASGFDDADQPVEDFREMTYSSYEESYRAIDDFLSDGPLTDRFTSATVPLMVIFGAEDQLFDAEASIAGYASVPGVETATISDAGHSPQVERPQQVAAKLEGFAGDVVLAPAPAPKSRRDRQKGEARKDEDEKKTGDRKQAGKKQAGKPKSRRQGSKKGD